ncbi:hypothetical protein Q5P01_021290 [Channa striata]|uniref:Uncharacterized protein n=1 Tax=Channa striata TaxID=64152 RepID=A0AA88LU05_CHASR|nr:hypothetical protein Q5P01_021290 [Channa striata]
MMQCGREEAGTFESCGSMTEPSSLTWTDHGQHGCGRWTPCAETPAVFARNRNYDAEVARRAQEEGECHLLFRFVSEILCILYQRQQLPMTHDHLVYSQKKRQASVQIHNALNLFKGMLAVQNACVLLLMGGSLVLPKELCEINMESLFLAGGDQSLQVSSCLQQLDHGSISLRSTTVSGLAHRNCVPTCAKEQIIALSTDPNASMEPRKECSDWQDYVWFQAPVTIKGLRN